MLSEFREYVLADPTVAALIGTRMYPVAMPQKVGLPAVSYQTVGGISQPVMLHDDNLPMTRLQVDCWALSFSTAQAVDQAIRSLFHNFEMTIMGGSPGVLVVGVFKDSPRADYEPETFLYRASRDYRIFHAE